MVCAIDQNGSGKWTNASFSFRTHEYYEPGDWWNTSWNYRKEININQKLKEFYDKIKKHKLEDIICIDETSISGLQKRHQCYSELGKRCVIKTQSQEVFKKYTGIFSISYNGVLGWELYDKGGIDSDRLYEFLEKYITKKYKNKLIILDNASNHRNEKIKELLNKHNTLLYSIFFYFIIITFPNCN